VVLIAITLRPIATSVSSSGGLIKAALSRQREYLADASSVQFTRAPAPARQLKAWRDPCALRSSSGRPRARQDLGEGPGQSDRRTDAFSTGGGRQHPWRPFAIASPRNMWLI